MYSSTHTILTYYHNTYVRIVSLYFGSHLLTKLECKTKNIVLYTTTPFFTNNTDCTNNYLSLVKNDIPPIFVKNNKTHRVYVY